MALEKAALSDQYFVERKLYPNVDFYSGLIYRAMGFPTDFFPVLFALPRCVGWLAHWRESLLEGESPKIWRPRQLYLGQPRRDYVPMEARTSHQDEIQDLKIDTHPFNRRYVIAMASKL